MNTKKEIEIIRDCLGGAESAFKALYDMYSGYVYTICTRYGINTLDVKDCMQTIFMELFKSLPKYDANKSKFKTWLTRITINQILSHKRKWSKNTFTLDTDETNLIESNFSIPIEAQMDEKIMLEILSKMPEKYSSVFNLFIIDGYSHLEIANALDITESTSRITLHRGRAWAMKELKETFKDSIDSLNKIRL